MSASDEGIQIVTSPISLRVEATLVPSGAPVEENQVVVDLDTAQVERELDAKNRELAALREERRWRTTNQDVARKGSSRSAFDGPTSQTEMTIIQREADAIRELLSLQAKLATARIAAPASGYVVQLFVAAGAAAKRRKAAFEFVELSRTRLTVEVEPAPPRELTLGGEVTVVSAADPAQRFRARVDSLVTTSEATAAYTLIPVELPFLHLNTAAEVVISERSGAGEPPIAVRRP